MFVQQCQSAVCTISQYDLKSFKIKIINIIENDNDNNNNNEYDDSKIVDMILSDTKNIILDLIQSDENLILPNSFSKITKLSTENDIICWEGNSTGYIKYPLDKNGNSILINKIKQFIRKNLIEKTILILRSLFHDNKYYTKQIRTDFTKQMSDSSHYKNIFFELLEVLPSIQHEELYKSDGVFKAFAKEDDNKCILVSLYLKDTKETTQRKVQFLDREFLQINLFHAFKPSTCLLVCRLGAVKLNSKSFSQLITNCLKAWGNLDPKLVENLLVGTSYVLSTKTSKHVTFIVGPNDSSKSASFKLLSNTFGESIGFLTSTEMFSKTQQNSSSLMDSYAITKVQNV